MSGGLCLCLVSWSLYTFVARDAHSILLLCKWTSEAPSVRDDGRTEDGRMGGLSLLYTMRLYSPRALEMCVCACTCVCKSVDSTQKLGLMDGDKGGLGNNSQGERWRRPRFWESGGGGGGHGGIQIVEKERDFDDDNWSQENMFIY